MLKNYVKNTPNKEDIPPEVLDSCLQILDKCIKLKDRNAPLMAKVLDLGTNLYPVDKYKPNIENLGLLKSINNDMPKFKNDHDYLNSALNCISTLTKDNPYNGQEALNCGLFQSLNNEVSNLLKDGPEKFDQKNEGDEANGYLKTCFNLAKLYNSLVKNDMDNIDKFNKLGVTENTIKMLDTFNDKIKPLTEEEKEALDEKKAKLLKAGQKKTEPYRNKALSDSKDEKMPIQCIKLRSDQLENLADLKNNLPKKYTAEDLFESPDNKFEEDLNPDYYYMKILDDARSRPFPGLEKVDTGDDNILVLKISKKSLENYSKPDIPQDQLSKVRHLFKEADEQNAGVECYYRKVLDKDLDHPETAKLEKIPLDEDVDELYNKIKEKEGEFKSPEEGIQLLKVVGFNVNPKELNNHIVDVKKLYNKKDKEGHSSGTTVQCVKVNRPNKEGKKEPVQFIKTVRGEVKPGEEPISFYRVGGNADLRQLLEDIQTTGVPKGKDGVDYIKVKGDADLADVRELFKGTENDPKTYYYTSQAKGDGKVYGDGKINSVTVLSDPKNKLNKNSQVLQVFRKVEDANQKPVKDNDKYYYTKALGDLNKGLKPNETTRDTNMKDIYNKVKGDMSNKPDDEEYIFLIKVKGDKSVNDALNKIKLSGAMDSRPAQPEENDFHLNKIRGNTKMKDVYLDVKKPNGALLIKAPKDNGLDDIIKQVKTSGILKDEKGKKPLLKSSQGKDREQPREKSYISSPDSKVIGKPQKVKGNDNIQYMLLKGDMLNKFDNPNNLGSMFKSGKPEKTPDRNPVFYYRKISSPPSPDDSDLKNIQGKTNVDDLYKQLKNSGAITGKPKEGVQIFKVTGPVDSNDFVKHIQDSEALYKKPDEEDQQIRVRSVKLYPHGKEAGEDDCIVYIKVTGGNKPDTYYKNQGPVDLNDFMQQIQEKGTPEKNGKPYEVVSGDELNKVKGYFKPKDDDLKKPKEKSDDGKSPKAYFYTSKVISKGDKENPSIINSVTLLSDPNNNLNKGQNMEQLFKGGLKGDALTSFYFAPFTKNTKDDDNIQLQQLDGKSNINEVYDQIKNYGAKINRDGDGIQLIKTSGTVGTSDMAQHLTEARNNSKMPDKDGNIPDSYYYKTKVLGTGAGKDGNLEGERIGKVDSVTIKRDPDNNLHKGKDVETAFKEAEEEEEEDKGDKADLGQPIYYYAKIKGGVIDKPEEVKLEKIPGNKKIDEIYKEAKKLGPMEKHDGIQLYKVSGEVDNDNLLAHVKEAGELFNNPEDDQKSDEPTTSYFTTEVFGESIQNKDGKESGLIQSVTVNSDDLFRNKNLKLGTLFNREDGNDDDEEGEEGVEEIKNPILYYTKLRGGESSKPDKDLQIVKIRNDTKMSDLDKDKGTILIKASDELDQNEILALVNKLGIAHSLYRFKEEEPKAIKGDSIERKKAIQFAKVSPAQLSSLNAPDLEQKYKVDEMFSPVDPEEAEEDPNPKYYYTKVVPEGSLEAKQEPVLNKVSGDSEMGDIYKFINKKGGDSNKNGDEGALLVKAPQDTTLEELKDMIKNDGLNLKKPEDSDEDEITTSIYYTTEEIIRKPKEVPKILDGNIPLTLYYMAKSEDGKDNLLGGDENYEIVPDENETADDKMPNEMVRDIMSYSVGILDQLTVAPQSNEFLAKNTSFSDSITKALLNENNDLDLLLTGLHSLGNYLFSENGPNYSKLDLPKTYELLHDLQSKYYANPDILTQVNYISGSLVKNLKDDNEGKDFTQKFYELIPESIKCQDNNPDLVLLSLKLMHDGLEKKPYLADEVYDTTVPDVINLLKLYKDNPDIQEAGYSILSQFAQNKVYAASMINNGVLPLIKEILENVVFSDTLKEKYKPIKSEVLKLLSNISKDEGNSPKIADEIMGQLIQDLNDRGYTEESNGKEILQLLNTLLGSSQCVAPFAQCGGIDAVINLLNKNESNVELAMGVFKILKKLSNSSDEYKKMLQEKKVPNLINRIIKKIGVYDKKLEYEGRQLAFNVNLCKVELEDPNKINVSEIQIVEPIPPRIRNFLISGKQIKSISENGDVKEMQLIFSQDLMKVSLKKIKSNLPPKPKYIIDTPTIKKILKGHGTDAFKKSKGFFRSIPKPEVCFSIIGPTTVDGTKAFNIECENEKEVDKWIEYLKVVINYFKKTHTIKGTVLIKK